MEGLAVSAAALVGLGVTVYRANRRRTQRDPAAARGALTGVRSEGKIHRPFLETEKRTDQECRKSWLCCGRREGPADDAPFGRRGSAGTPSAEDAVARRREPDKPRWKGLVALAAVCVFSVCGSCVMWTTNAFDNFVANQIILDESKSTFGWWVDPPIKAWYKVYIWNYTNWDEYLQNTSIKIKLREVGPYVFRESIRRDNIKFDDEGITLSFRETKSYKFMPDMSGGDPNATVRVPSLAAFCAQAELAKVEQTMSLWNPLKMMIGLGGGMTTRMLESNTHVEVKAMDFIRGYQDELFVLSKMFKDVPIDSIGMLVARSTPFNVTMWTGASDVDRMFYYAQYNNRSALGAWSDAACDVIEGSDASLFPPRVVRAKQPVYIFKADACRLIKFVYQENVYAQGLLSYRYIMDRGTLMSPRTFPSNLCYCNETDLDDCALDGLFDASPCFYGTPAYISYPHFYLTDPKAREPFEGMNPNEEEHDMSADIHPRLGITLQGRTRTQLNVRVAVDLPRVKKGLVLPVAWLAQDMPPYEGAFRVLLVVLTHGLDALEFALLYVLPVVALLTAFLIARRLLVLRRELRNKRTRAAVAKHEHDELVKDPVSCHTWDRDTLFFLPPEPEEGTGRLL